MDIIKVAGSSRTSAVAGAIAGVFRENRRAEVQAIGAGAVNQAIKAMVLARGYLENDGISIAFIPTFSDVEIDGKTRTAIKIYVEEHDVTSDIPAFSLGSSNPSPAPQDASPSSDDMPEPADEA